MKKLAILFLFLLVFVLLLSFNPNFVLGGITNSTYNLFNATNVTEFNWTSSVITIGSYNDSIQMKINNITTGLSPDYSYLSGELARYGATKWGICFPDYQSSNYNISFVVQNQTSDYTTNTSLLSEGEGEDFTLSIHPFCPPGKYSGYFTVTRVDNSSDKVDVITTINIPISVNNTLDATNNNAYFNGTISINDTYHSYYFNTSEIPENITGLSIKLGGLSDDVDIFLFDGSGILRGKSIERGTSEEYIIGVDLPSSWAMWEIRVYGNESSSYRGDLYFSSLNTSLSSINFGDLEPNKTESSEFTLENEDDRILSNVYEYAEIYHVDTWGMKNTSQDITDFLVPTFAEKVKVKIEWTGESGKSITDWDLYLTDSSGNLIGNSTNKFFNANKTSVTREEYIVYNGPFSNEGFWNISVRNQTNATTPFSYFNVTAYIWMDNSWISTNYSTFTFNSSGSTNDSYGVGINMTTPLTQVLDGRYEGFLKYNSSQGWNIRLPLLLNVSVGTLIINNSLSVFTKVATDNIGFNRLGSNPLTTSVIINNTGSNPIWYVNETSNYTLIKDSYNISFKVDNWPSNPINPGTSEEINISFYINTTFTGNEEGYYSGWVFFNTTNDTLNSSSYPYKTFNMTLQVYLTDSLRVEVESVNTSDKSQMIRNPSSQENISFVTKVYLINGSQLGDTDDPFTLYVENFTSAYLTETNVSTTYYLSNISQKESPGSPDFLCSGPPLKCYVNATTPANIIGGTYKASISVQWNTSESLLSGTGSYYSLVSNETGLHMSTNASTCNFGVGSCNPWFEMENGSANTVTYYVNISNFGPLAGSSETINFTENCGGYSVAVADRSGCGSSSQSGTLFTISPPAYSSSCLVWWTITPGSSHASYCEYDILGTPTTEWFNSIDGQIKVTTTSSTSTSTSTATTAATTAPVTDDTATTTSTTTTTIPPSDLDITSYPSTVTLEQGNSTTEWVRVKNTNTTHSQTVTFSIVNLTSSWYNITNPTRGVVAGGIQSFMIRFGVPNDAGVADYNSKFNATGPYGSTFKSFVLTVTPGSEMKIQINSSILNYQTELSALLLEINETKSKGYNTTEVEDYYELLKDKIDVALSYRDDEDYKSAYDIFPEIDNLFNETRTALSLASKPSDLGDWWSWGKWVVIGAVGVVGAFLGYLFWPTEGVFKGKVIPKPELKAPTQVKGKLNEKFDKLKERWRKIREKKEKTKYHIPKV